MKKLLLTNVFLLTLFMAFGQVSKTNAVSGTIISVPSSGAHLDRTFSFGSAEFTACTGLTEVEISIRLILGNGTPPTPGAYGVHEDLNLRLVSPSGTAVDLVQDRWGYWTSDPTQLASYNSFAAVDGTVHFDDDHPTSIVPVGPGANDWITGNFSPHNPLSTFDGENPVGTWTLRISDGNSQFGASDYVHFVESTLTVTCGVSCTEPDVPTITATPNPICNGGSTTLNISGSLNDATQWHIYTGFCGVTQVGTTTGSTFNVSPTTTTSYYVRGEGGCATPGTCGAFTVTVSPGEDAGFNYSSSAYCVDAADPTPTITGVPGGTFAATTAGLSLNTSTGAIDVSTSTPGTYTVEYTTPGSCPGTSNVNVTINPLDDAGFNYSTSSYCANEVDPTPTITGLTGGTFSSTPGLSINSSTGQIDLSASTGGTYTVTYTTVGTCPNNSSQNVTINSAPAVTFTAPADLCVAAGVQTGLGGGTPTGGAYSGPGVTDDGNGMTYSFDPAAAGVGVHTITYSYADGNGCVSTASDDIEVTNSDDASFSYSAASYCANDANPTPTITGATGGAFTSTAGLVINASTGMIDLLASVPGTYTVTYTTSGSCSNSSTQSVAISAVPTAPTTTALSFCPGEDVILTATGSGVGNIIFYDNAMVQVSSEPMPPATASVNIGAMANGSYTYFATEENGGCESATSSIDFFVGDVTNPIAVCQDLTLYVDGAGTVSIVAPDLDGGSTDNCGAVTLSASQTSFDCSNIGGPVPVTLTVTDGSGNSSSCIANVTVLDTISPTISCSSGIQNVSEDGIGDCTFTPFIAGQAGTYTIGDNCSSALTVQEVFTGALTATATWTLGAGTHTPVQAFPVGVTNVTVTVTDGAGNSTSCSYTTTIVDDEVPTAVCQDITVFLDGSGSASIVASDIDGGSSDLCGTVILAAAPTVFTCAETGANTVTLTVLDENGNIATCTSTVTVSDSTSPVVTCPGNQTEIASATCDLILPDYSALVSATDNCATAFTFTQSPAAGTLITSNTTVTFTTDDGNGNTGSCSFDVILDVSACAGAECSNAIVVGPHDPCGETTVVSGTTTGGTPNTEPFFCGTSLGSGGANWYTFTGDGSNWTASTVSGGTNYDTKLWVYEGVCGSLNCVAGNDDFTGVQSQVSFPTTVGLTYYVVVGGFSSNEGNYDLTLTSVEVIAPVPDVATLADVTGVCEITSLTEPTATDNCSPTVTVTNDATLPIATQGTTVVTWTYDDGNGNTSTQTQNVVLTDVTPPVADVATLADVTAECEVASLTDPTATDNCGGVVTVTNDATLPISGQGTTVVTWTYDDGNGNITTQTQNIIVNDVTAPTPDVATLPDLTGDCSIDTPTAPTATDNCAGAITGTTTTTFPITAIGTTTIVWEFDDGNGNITTQTQDAVNAGVDASTTLSADGITITANTSGATYEWLNCDFGTIVAGETGQSFTATANGNYAVIVTVGNCSDTSACENISSVGIDALSIDQLSVYPNPSENGFFTVKYEGTIEAIDVVDMLGRVIGLPTDLTTGLVDGSQLAYGRYMVRVTTDKSVLTTEIVIAK